MKRIVLMMLALAAMCAASGATASVSMAEKCVPLEEPGFGNWTNATCTEKAAGQQKNYIKIQQFVNQYQPGQWCAEIELSEAVMLPQRFENAQCNNLVNFGHFEKVYGRPGWTVNGKQLKQGTKQLKLQLKGVATLTAEVGKEVITITCQNSISEGVTIEGEGNFQGQGKGRTTYTQCTAKNGCPVNWPITTKQTKSHLVTVAGRQTKYAMLFEPTEGEVYTTIKLGGACLLALNVTGSVAAEVLPATGEVQEGMLVFPSTPISSVLHEEEERKPKLLLEGKEAKFAAVYGARLQSNEPFGVAGG